MKLLRRRSQRGKQLERVAARPRCACIDSPTPASFHFTWKKQGKHLLAIVSQGLLTAFACCHSLLQKSQSKKARLDEDDDDDDDDEDFEASMSKGSKKGASNKVKRTTHRCVSVVVPHWYGKQ